MLDRFFKLLFGDDIFISYSRSDGATYAAGLASALADKNFSCKFDQWGTPPGRELPKPLIKALRRSAVLVLVGTRGASVSSSVKKEVEEFLKTKRMIIPIDVDGTIRGAEWWTLIEGIHASSDKPDSSQITERQAGEIALQTGNPSAAVINRIDKTYNFSRKDQRLRTIALAVTGLLVMLVVASVVAAGVAGYQMREAARMTRLASDEATKANEQKLIADGATQRAVEQTRIANDATKQAAAQKSIADEAVKKAAAQTELAEKATAEASRQTTLANQATEKAVEQTQLADQAEKRRGVAELQERRSSLRAQAREALNTSNAARAFSLSREAIKLSEEHPGIGDSQATKLLFAQTVNKGLPIVYPYFKHVEEVRINSQGSHVAAIGDGYSSQNLVPFRLSNELKVWRLDGTQLHSIRGWFTRMEFTPDGSSLLVGATVVEGQGRQGKYRTELRWYSLDLKLQKTIRLPGEEIFLSQIQFTKDAKRVVLGGEYAVDHTATSPPRGRELYPYRAWMNVSDSSVSDLAEVDGQVDEPSSPVQSKTTGIFVLDDSNTVVSNSATDVFLYDLNRRTRTTVGTFETGIQGIAASPTGERIAVIEAGNGVTILTRSEKGWEPAKRPLPGDAGTSMVRFIGEGRVAAVRTDFTINLLTLTEEEEDYPQPDSEERVLLREEGVTTLRGHTNTITALEVGPGRRWLSTASTDGTIRTWNLAENFQREFGEGGGGVYVLDSDSAGHWLVGGGVDGVRLWRAQDPYRFSLPGDPQSTRREKYVSDALWLRDSVDLLKSLGIVRYSGWSPDGNYYLSLTYSGKLTLWSKDFKPVKSIDLEGEDLNNPSTEVAFTGDSRWVFVTGRKRRIDFWEINGGRHFEIMTDAEFTPHLFSPRGQWAEIGPDKALILHDIEGGIDGSKLASGVFSPKGKWFAAHQAQEILLWRADGAQAQPVSIPFTNQLTFGADVSRNRRAWMEFPQTEEYLAVFLKAEDENAIEVVDLSDFRHTVLKGRWLLADHALSPDGKWISAGGWASDVFLWSVKGGPPTVLGKHSLGVTSVAFSPDSKWLASGSRDRSVRLWSLEGKDNFELKLLNPVLQVGFSPDGIRLMAASGPATHSWFVPTGQTQYVLSNTDKLTNARYSDASQTPEYSQPSP